MKSLSLTVIFLILTILGCENKSAQPSADKFDPCDAVRQLDPHCGWKPHWESPGESVNKMDGTKIQGVFLEASDADGTIAGTLHYPKLRLCFKNGSLCGHDAVGAGIVGHTMIEPVDYGDNNHETAVRVRFDDEKPSRQTWGISDSQECLFPFGHEKQFVRELLRHKTLYVEFAYLNESRRTVSFQLDGLQEILDKEKLHIE